tara:strand:- start:2112 stop:2597 length:486 start_codon:yes stop_codon:yes gene_type:complete
MSNQENPTAGVGNAGIQTFRQGPEVPNPLKPYKARPAITTDVLAGGPPAALKNQCIFVGRHTHVEFVVKPAPNAVSYDLVYGRWQQSINVGKNPLRAIDNWMEVGRISVLVADEPIARVQFETNTDAVAAYIESINPTPGTGEGYLMFYRGVSGVTGSADT